MFQIPQKRLSRNLNEAKNTKSQDNVAELFAKYRDSFNRYHVEKSEGARLEAIERFNAFTRAENGQNAELIDPAGGWGR